MKKIYLLLLIPFLFGFTGKFTGIIGTPCTPQTISFTQPADMTVGDADQTLTYSATSGLTVSLDTNNHSYCTIVSNKLHAVAASGTNGCTVKATQTGGGLYCAATELDRSVTISNAACSTIAQSYAAGTEPVGLGEYDNTIWGATKFTVGTGYTACAVSFAFSQVGTVGAKTLTACIWADATGTPSTQVICSSAVAESTVYAGTPYKFTFTAPTALTGSTVYWVGLKRSASGATNYLTIMKDASYDANAYAFYDSGGGTWATFGNYYANFIMYK